MIVPFYGVWLLIITAVQSTVLNGIEIFSVKPNLFLVFVVAVALLRGRREGMIIGALFGFVLDLTAGRLIGVYGGLYLYVGFAVGFISETFISRAHFAFNLVFTFFATFLSEFLYLLFAQTILNTAGIGYAVLHIALPETLYNTVLAAALYFVILKSLKLIGGVSIDKY